MSPSPLRPPFRWLLRPALCLCLSFSAASLRAQIALVRQAPTVNSGAVEGSIRQMTPGNVTLNGGARIDGDLLVPGTPSVQLNGHPNYAGTLDGPGAASPSNYKVTLNGSVTLRHVVRRTDPAALPSVAAPSAPTGTATVNLNSPGQPVNWTALRHLTLNGGAGQYAVPPGSYGDFTANGASGFTLGVAGSLQPSVYNFQHLALNGNSRFDVIGPVIVTVATGFTANGNMGASGQPAWLSLRLASGGLTLNGNVTFHGNVLAPAGAVVINGNSLLVGGVTSDRLTVNGSGILRLQAAPAPNQPPTVAIAAPADGATFTAPAAFELAANAADPDGTLAKVEFFQGATKLGEDTTAPFTQPVSGLGAGAYTFTARATDNAGAATDSPAVAVTVSNPNQPPAVTLDAPANGAVFTAPAALTLAATAADADGAIAKVEFYQGATKLGEDATAPFTHAVTLASPGTFAFSTKAIDNLAATTTSATVTITVVNPNQSPTVALTAPADGASFDDPAGFTLVAAAADADGAIAKVEFFQDAVRLGEDTTAPYKFPVAALAAGTYDFLARATDNAGSATDSASIRLTVAHVNDAPAATAQTVSTPEDTPLALTLAATDPDGDALTFAVTTQPAHGALSGSAPNLTYTPSPDFNGADSFTFKVNDGQFDSAPATFALTITPVNDTPIAAAQSVSTPEDTPRALALAGADPDGDLLTFALATQPAHGTLSGTAPHLTYTPAANFNGADSFTFIVSDATSASAPATVSITVAAVNDLPVALPADLATAEDTPLAFDLTAADSDGDLLTFMIVTPLAHGTLDGTLDGALTGPVPHLTYTPAANYHGADTLVFKVADGAGESAPAEIRFAVASVNDAPTGASLALTLPEDTNAAVVLVGADPDGDPLTFALDGPPAHGTLTGTAPNLTYTPAANFHGADTFSYHVSDGVLPSGSHAVTLEVTPENDAPVALPQSAVTDEDTALALTLGGADADGDALTYLVATPPQHGALSGSGAALIYTPAANYHGSDSFAFAVSDGAITSTPATVTFAVAPVNDAPAAAAQSLATDEDTPLALTLTAADPENDALTYTVTTPPEHGTLTGAAPNLTYTPAANYHGPDTFAFTAQDATLTSAPAAITLAIAPVNDAPVAAPQTLTATPGSPLAITLTATDADGDTLTFTVTAPPTHGTLTGAAPNLTYTPATNYEGPDAIGFKVSDGVLESPSAMVSITISAPNAPPVPNAGPDQQVRFKPTGGPRPQGRILVNHDEWTLTDQGFSASPFAGAFARNIADFLTGGKSGAKFLAYTNVIPGSVDFIYTGNSLAAVMQQAGHTWVRSNTIAMTLANLQQYDAVFLGANTVDNQVLIDYVEGGGSVYLSAGTHWCGCDAAGEAALWNTFLEHFGLRYNSPYNGIGGTLPVFSDHPIFHGIQTLYFGNGNSVSLVNPAAFPFAQIPYVYNGQGLFGLYGDFANQVFLYGAVTDDGRPNPPAAVTTQWTQIAGPAAATIAAPNSLTTRVEFPVSGSYTFRLTANDGSATSTDDVVVIANIPPEVDAGPDQGIVELAQSVALVATVTDDNVPHAPTLLWKSVAGPGTVTFASAGAAATTATFSAPGRYVLEFSADDGLETARDLVEISVALVFSVEGPGNMAAWWPGNGNPGDLVGGHDAVLKNEAGYAVGEVSLGFSLDGTNDYLEVPASSDLDIGASSAGLTIELWAKPSRIQDAPMVQWANGGTEGLALWQWGGGVGLWAQMVDTNNQAHGIQTSNVFTTGAWTHVALTYDKTTGLARLYRDGVMLVEQNVGIFTPRTNVPMTFGKRASENRFYAGVLDEITLYSRPLTLAEIQAIYNSGATGKAPIDDNTPPIVNAGPDRMVLGATDAAILAGTVSDDGKPAGRPLVITWSKVDGPGTVTFANANTAANTATFSAAGTYLLRLDASDGLNLAQGDTMVVRVGVIGAVAPDAALAAWWPANGEIHEVVHGNHDMEFLPRGPAFATGQVNQGFVFNGTDHYGRTAAHAELDIGAASAGLTIELWAKPSRIQDAPMVQWANGGTEGLALWQWGGGVGLWAQMVDTNNQAHGIQTSNVFTTGAWTHVALTYDKTTGLARLYRDGVMLVEQNVGIFTPRTNVPMTFGKRASENRYYAGILDEISLYTRPLTLTEIQAIYSAGAAGKTPAGNQAPTVSAGPDVNLVSASATAILAGTVTDDGQPATGTLASTWTKVDGLGTVTFANANAAATTATFSVPGIYVLRLDANDSELQAAGDTMVVRVGVTGGVTPDTALAAWWPANGEIHEVVHGNHDMEFLPRGPAFATGQAGQGFAFNGADHYGRTAAHAELDIGAASAGLTIELWAKPSRIQDAPMVQWANGGTEGLALWQWGGGVGLWAQMIDTNNQTHGIQTSNVFTTGAWTHVALTYDKTTGLARLYRDGVMLAEQNVGIFTPRTNVPMTFGKRASENRFYAGVLDEITLYSRPLTLAEIQAIYNSGTFGKAPIDDNTPPVVDAGPDRIMLAPTDAAALAGTVSDDGKPVGRPLVITWSKVDGPGTVTFANTNTAATTATFSAAGTYLLRLDASDGLNLAQGDTMVVRVGVIGAVAPDAALAAWWPANGEIHEVVHGNHDMEFLPRGPAFATGHAGQGFAFNGADHYGRTAAHADLDIGAAAAGLTIELWAKPGRTQDVPLVQWASATTEGLSLRQWNGGVGLYAFMTDTTGAGHQIEVQGMFAANTWAHVALTYDKATGLARLYRNGALVKEQNLGIFTPQTTYPLQFGSLVREGRYYQGILDEISLYTRPLALAEIQAIYSAGAAGKTPAGNRAPTVSAGPDVNLVSASATINLAGSVLDDGLPTGSPLAIGWSRIEGPGSVSFANASAAATTATFGAPGIYVLRLDANDGELQAAGDTMVVRVGVSGGVAPDAALAAWWPANGEIHEVVHGNHDMEFLPRGPAFATGQVSQGFVFNGADHYGRTAAHADLNIGASAAGLTIELWAKPARAQDVPLVQWATATTEGLSLRQWNGGVGLYAFLTDTVGAGHQIEVQNMFVANTWAHVALTYDKATGLARLYRNGVLVREQNLGSFTPQTTYPMQFGSLVRENRYYAGTLDEISLYTRPLSTAEITAIYNAGAAGKSPSPQNQAPVVNAGPDASVATGAALALAATASDDGLPNPPATLATQWSKLSGPGNVAFSAPTALATSATFDLAGAYTLRLTATDSVLTATDDLVVTVTAPPANPPVVALTSPAAGSTVVAAVPVSLTASATVSPGTIAKVEFLDGATLLGERTAPDTVGGTLYTFTVPAGFTAGSHSLAARATSAAGATATSPVVTITAGAYTGAPVLEISTPAEDARLSAPTTLTGIVAIPSLTGWALDHRLKTADGDPAEPWTQFASGSNLVGTPAAGATPAIPGSLGVFDPTSLLNGIHEIRLRALAAPESGGGGIGPTYIAGPVTVVVEGNMKVGAFTLAFEDLNLPVAGVPISITRTYDSRDRRVGDFGPGWRLAVANIRVQKNRNLGAAWFQTLQSGSGIQFYYVEPVQERIVTVTMPDGETHRFRAGAYVKVRPGDPDNASFAVVADDGLLKFYPLGDTTSTLEPVDAAGQLDEHFYIHGTGDQDLRTEDQSDPFSPTYNPTRFRLTTKDGTKYLLDERLGLLELRDLSGNTLVLNRDAQERVTAIVSTLPASSVHPSPVVTSVTIHRDASGRVDYIRDPANHDLDYLYDAQGRLASFTDREGNLTQFRYSLLATHSSLLTEILDPRGVSALRSEFDVAGKLVKQIDADGRETVFARGIDATGRFERTTDRLGQPTTYHYDPRGNITAKLDPLGAQTSYSYDANDNQTSVTDPLGHTSTMTYDARKNVLTQSDALGNTTTFTYNALSLPLTITDPRGKVTTNEYDAAGNLTRTTDPTGAVMEFTYDSTGRLTQTKDALNQVTTHTYGADGRLASAANALGHATSWTYDTNGNRLTQTATRTKADGSIVTETTSYVYDSEDRLTKTTLADGTFVETAYNSFGKTASTKDQLGRVTSFTYDARGNLTRTDYPDSTFETTAYDLESRVTATTDRLGHTTATTYDTLGRATRVTAADGTFTQTAYDTAGRVISSTDALGHVTTFGYDNAGRRTTITNALSEATSYVFDAAGNLLSFKDALNQTTGYAYDDRGLRTTVTFPDGTTQLTTFDGLGRKIAATDQAGKITRYRYDAVGRLVEVRQYIDQTLAASDTAYNLPLTTGDLAVTRYTYDELGNQITQTDALDHVTRYEYDALGRRVKRTLPDGAAETYAYNSVGSLTAKTDFNGRTTTFGYDALYRLKSKSADLTHPSLIYSHAIARVEYDYDANGARIAARTFNASNTQLYSETTPRDQLGRPDAKTTALGTLDYSYDANSQLEDVVSSNSGGVNTGYRYDALNRLVFVDDASGVQSIGTPLRTSAYTYNAVGNLATATAANGIRHGYAYDTLNRLTSLSVSNLASQILCSYTYTLNPSGHRSQISESTGRTANYIYDGVYRLTSETVAGVADPGQISYTLDKVGNRTARSSSVTAVPSVVSTFNSRDWLASDTYDANGNTLRTTLDAGFGVPAADDVYDFEDRLIIRRKADGTTINLGYDSDGIRVQKTIFNASSVLVSATGYLVDSNNLTGYAQVVEEYQNSASGMTATVYTYGSDLISKSVLQPSDFQSSVSYFGYDGLGSVRQLTDASGAVTDTWDYDAFGVLIARTGTTANNYLYRGEQFDADLGMYFLRARFYNQATGRFWNADTYEGSMSDPASLHRYLYGNGCPLSYTDPSGKVSMAEIQIGMVIVGTLNGMAINSGRNTINQVNGIFSPTGELNTSLATLDQALFVYEQINFAVAVGAGSVLAKRGLEGAWRTLAPGIKKAWAKIGQASPAKLFQAQLGRAHSAKIKGETQLEFDFTSELNGSSGLVIGRNRDLSRPGAFKVGEYRLDWFAESITDDETNIGINIQKLQDVMRHGLSIRDASSLSDTAGRYTNVERMVLQDAKWFYEWSPTSGGRWLPQER